MRPGRADVHAAAPKGVHRVDSLDGGYVPVIYALHVMISPDSLPECCLADYQSGISRRKYPAFCPYMYAHQNKPNLGNYFLYGERRLPEPSQHFDFSVMTSIFGQTREPGDVERFTHQRLRLADCDNGERFPASMRVLELQPAIHATSPLRCRLREVLLAEARITHFYEALSYVWGSSNGRKYILCDDRRLSITVNCWTALVALRRRFRKRTLWIDAICIDQAEHEEALKERSQQVRVMGDIYLYASKVLVWLGPGDDSTPRVFMILKVFRRYTKLKPLWMRTRRLLRMPLSGFYESFAFAGLNKLLQRDKMSELFSSMFRQFRSSHQDLG